MSTFLVVIRVLEGLVVFTVVAVGGIMLFGRLLMAVRARIAAPMLAQQAQWLAEREQIMRDCTADALQIVTAGQLEAESGVTREGFSAMLEVNRELLSEVRSMQTALTTPRQAIPFVPTVPAAPPWHKLAAGKEHALASQRTLLRRLQFWKR